MVHIMALAAALALYQDVNAERARFGLRPLVLDSSLARGALAQAEDMARNGYFGHEDSAGNTPFDRMRAQGCVCAYAAENIAVAPDVPTADAALFGSAPHRENMLSAQYDRVGIGVASDMSGNVFFVEDFSS